MIVADASVIVELLVPGPQSARVERLRELEPIWVAPTRWKSECVSVLYKKLRHGQIDLRQAMTAVDLLDGAVSHSQVVDPRLVLELATETPHSPYDCEYVVLARELQSKFVTLDRRVIELFPAIACTPFGFLELAGS